MRVQQRYQRNYATPEKMGKLRFSEIEVRMLGDNHALVLGKFELTRAPSTEVRQAGDSRLYL